VKKYEITSQDTIRKAFWILHRTSSKRKVNGDYPTDTRVNFVDFVDALRRSGRISEELAQRVTL